MTHFYGTLNLLTGEEIVTQSTKMDSIASAKHLKAVLETYPEMPILLLWDRATWHGGEAVREVLDDHPRLEVMRFPTAAPDLNPQEHVWKATRSAVSHNHNVRRLPDLAERFEAHLSNTRFCYSFLEKYDYTRICDRFK